MLPNIQSRELTELSAQVALGVLTLEDAAAEAGVSPEEVIRHMEVYGTDVDAAAARIKTSGQLAEIKAGGLLLRVLSKFEEQMDELTPASATRVAEILLRISGLAEKRSAELRQPVASPGTGFSVNIIIRGENVTHRNAAPKVIEHDALGEPLDE